MDDLNKKPCRVKLLCTT